MGDSGQYLVGQPSVLFTAIFAARVISSSPRCFMEGGWQTHSMLTRTSHFTPNKSGISISVLCNRCFISITSQFGWAGGGNGIGTIFQKITLSICGLWPVQSTPTSHIGVEIMLRLWKYIVGHISFKMRYHIGVYVNYGAFCSYFSNITPKI